MYHMVHVMGKVLLGTGSKGNLEYPPYGGAVERNIIYFGGVERTTKYQVPSPVQNPSQGTVVLGHPMVSKELGFLARIHIY